MRNEVQNIISGKVEVRYGASINAAVSYLIRSTPSSELDKNNKQFKRAKTQRLHSSVVEQAFIQATEKTDLTNVCQFMQANGFERVRTNDYYSSEFGILIEDLHDENVLTCNGILYFIDTVIYIQ